MRRRRLARFAVVGAMLVVASVAVCQGDDSAALRRLDTANGLLNRGLAELAIPEYEAFLREHPRHAEADTARYALGVCHYRGGAYESALEVLGEIRGGEGFAFGAEAALVAGDCLMRLGRFGEAARGLREIVEGDGDGAVGGEAGALLVEALHRAGRHGEAVEAARGVVEGWPAHGGRGRVELYWGMSLSELGRDGEAARVLERVVERGGDEAVVGPARLVLAQSLHREGDVEGAMAWYREVVARGEEEDRAEALLGLAQLLRRGGEVEEARAVLGEYLGRYSDHSGVGAAHLEMALVHFDAGRYGEAQRHARIVMAGADATLHDDGAYWSAKASLRMGRAGEAARGLSDALERYGEGPLRAEMMYDLGVALWRAGELEGAGAAFARFRREFGGHALAGDALLGEASLALERGALGEARRLAGRYLEAHGGDEGAGKAGFVLGEAAYLEGDYGDAAEVFGAMVEGGAGGGVDGERLERARYRLGMSLFRLGRFDEARVHLEGVVGGEGVEERFSAGLAALGEMAFEDGAWGEAVEWLGRYVGVVEAGETWEGGTLKMGLALARLGRQEEALARFDALLGAAPGSVHAVQARFERGQSLMALGRDGEAAEAFEGVVEADGSGRFGAHAMRHLGTLAMERGDAGEAARWFGGASRSGESGVAAVARYERARALLESGEAAGALRELDGLMGEGGLEEGLAARVGVARAVALGRLGRHEAALGAIEGVDVGAQDAVTRRALLFERASALRALGRGEEAGRAFRALVDEGAEGDIRAHALLGLASIEMERERFGEAAGVLDALLADGASGGVERGVMESARYRRGVCASRLGDEAGVVEALGTFREAYSGSALADSADLLCAEALVGLGRRVDAVERLERASAEGVDGEVRRSALMRLGGVSAELGDWEGSRGAYGAFLEAYPGDELWFRARFGVGWALENEGRHGEAIESYREVVDRHRGETAARAQFQIGECLFAQGSHEEAVRELLRVEILYAYPEWSAAAVYEAGRCFEGMGKVGEARGEYRRVVDEYGETTWGALARERLERMRGAALPGRGE